MFLRSLTYYPRPIASSITYDSWSHTTTAQGWYVDDPMESDKMDPMEWNMLQKSASNAAGFCSIFALVEFVVDAETTMFVVTIKFVVQWNTLITVNGSQG